MCVGACACVCVHLWTRVCVCVSAYRIRDGCGPKKSTRVHRGSRSWGAVDRPATKDTAAAAAAARAELFRAV